MNESKRLARMLAEKIAHLETGSQSYEAYISEIESLLQAELEKASFCCWDAKSVCNRHVGELQKVIAEAKKKATE